MVCLYRVLRRFNGCLKTEIKYIQIICKALFLFCFFPFFSIKSSNQKFSNKFSKQKPYVSWGILLNLCKNLVHAGFGLSKNFKFIRLLLIY
ncbi:hypothetical protein SAMN05444285_13139 [Draconibacterium orientale]|uniref:Uncharacterized protein n=1 Tax=Draconibacterium orientale TaxID=1168034 RepID=A0A1I0IDS3_9BACT|nr:hypothetical protein SAMN05444285_13139 [Draconibacterium orientale]